MHPKRLDSLKRCRAGHVIGHELNDPNERQGFICYRQWHFLRTLAPYENFLSGANIGLKHSKIFRHWRISRSGMEFMQPLTLTFHNICTLKSCLL
jgi:hypothetical protein